MYTIWFHHGESSPIVRNEVANDEGDEVTTDEGDEITTDEEDDGDEVARNEGDGVARDEGDERNGVVRDDGDGVATDEGDEMDDGDGIDRDEGDGVARDEGDGVVRDEGDGGDEDLEDVNIQVDDERLFEEDITPPLYSGCTKYTRFSIAVILYKHKAIYGLSNNGFNELLKIMVDMLPQENILPKSLQEVKKLLKEYELHYEKIHACVNDCCLFRKENEALDACPKCKSSRWKVSKSNKETKKKFLLRS
ncbi:hypothetical protein Scep_007882 [Stephania cephalantha]|uniref:Transposase n=1 Tax=Stephania cephalantha TaxID=152367 RepID=A0AAP0PP66_9MAGN